MSLGNLLKIGQLKQHPIDAEEIERLLTSASRSIRDASVTTISPETRFDAAYRAIMQCALAAILMHGYRPDTNKPGHHATVIQTLPVTIGLAADRIAVLDTLRRQRNLVDYTGDAIDESTVQHCVDEARRLLKDVTSWRKTNRPKLIIKS